MFKTLVELLISFGKIGLIALGGGNSMLKLMEYEAVDYRHWIAREEYGQMLGSTFIFPGLTGVKLSALIGYKAAGLAGLIVAVLSLNLPGLIMALAGYQWLSSHDTPMARKIMLAVQYGGIALLAAATFSVAQGVVGVYSSWAIIIATLAFFLLLCFWQLSPFWGFLLFILVSYFLVN